MVSPIDRFGNERPRQTCQLAQQQPKELEVSEEADRLEPSKDHHSHSSINRKPDYKTGSWNSNRDVAMKQKRLP